MSIILTQNDIGAHVLNTISRVISGGTLSRRDDELFQVSTEFSLFTISCVKSLGQLIS